MRRLPKHRRPVTPGEVLREDFLNPLNMTQKEAAQRLKISYPRMNEIVQGHRSVTPDTALRLARLTKTEPEFWLNLQQAVEYRLRHPYRREVGQKSEATQLIEVDQRSGIADHLRTRFSHPRAAPTRCPLE